MIWLEIKEWYNQKHAFSKTQCVLGETFLISLIWTDVSCEKLFKIDFAAHSIVVYSEKMCQIYNSGTEFTKQNYLMSSVLHRQRHRQSDKQQTVDHFS